ncbi:PPOX class F420-dependent oxidoreductase [Gordonia sp. TBRC 11910]|uniref:PPOX class F420-dependent oxidoreductase n=1 Tax=Gordonia asplenii TaxID=2725283 RepID=A0A848KVB8_9ACTN|nr:PPOX class F420-dependent oxidoreductase [Gordonia asplenii]NMO02209.1 PPOX class F420-dependent oxidoreductase [Gordonia asplenii]
MSYSFDDPAIQQFLTEGTRTGHLAYTASDGRPLTVPIWFVVDGDRLAFNTGASTAKARAMHRDSRVSLCVDVQHPPYAFVTVQGTVELSDDLPEVKRIATACGGRYMGAERADEFGERNGVPGELVIWITPVKVLAQLDATA